MSELEIATQTAVDVVAKRVREFQERGEVHFPANYSPENAMKSAWLMLQEIKTGKNDGYRLALEVCTKNSIVNALLDMVVQGLNPAKKQGYFIVYGKTLAFQRSYFGTMAVCKQVTGAKDIFAQVVYKGDVFEYEIDRGKKKVMKHTQKIENVCNDIIAAYCIVELPDGKEIVDIMTMEQIKKAWSKSKMNPESKDSTHSQFMEEMAKKTVINRTCKALINSSDDSSLMIQTFNKSEETMAEHEITAEIAENANTEVIDAHYEVVDESSEDQPTIAGDTIGEPGF